MFYSFKIFFGASSEACSAIVTTIWIPGFNLGLFKASNFSPAAKIICDNYPTHTITFSDIRCHDNAMPPRSFSFFALCIFRGIISLSASSKGSSIFLVCNDGVKVGINQTLENFYRNTWWKPYWRATEWPPEHLLYNTRRNV